MIVFRVDTRCGLGHLMRMKWLALALTDAGQQCHFLLDLTALDVDFFDQFPAQVHWLPAVMTEADDASWCLIQLAALRTEKAPALVDWVIVDHYGLGLAWETQIKHAGYALLAMDDLVRCHGADVIVDAKWQGRATWQRYLTTSAEYLPQRLLGPDYAILAPEYAQQVDLPKKQQLMFSLGGGGDWTFLTALIAQLVMEPCMQGWTMLVVLGPYAVNTVTLLELRQQYPQIEVVHAPSSLLPYYRSSQFFVGALGTSLYELAATKTPALTFAVAANQQNELADLADLGHFIHLDSLDSIPVPAIAKLVMICLQHLPRIQLLRQQAKKDVDGLGAQRIAAFLQSQDQLQIPSAVVPLHQLSADEDKIFLTSTLVLRQVADRDINDYLIARNRADNSWRMTITQTIPRHEHYCWWFQQQRQSYVLEQHGKALLYVWQQMVPLAGQNYWIGGWFAASDDVNFSHAQLILDWQLTFAAQQQPDAIWLAVIHRENKFVQLLNQRAGFIALTEDGPELKAAQQLFPQAERSLFHFVGRWPSEE